MAVNQARDYALASRVNIVEKHRIFVDGVQLRGRPHPFHVAIQTNNDAGVLQNTQLWRGGAGAARGEAVGDHEQ